VKIYTKTGDQGETSLFGGTRVSKDNLRIDAYGTVDELNSVIGICRSMNRTLEVDAVLEEIQDDLFILGADLATPPDAKAKIARIQPADAARLEAHIDAITPQLQPLSQFILPGGNPTAAMIHFARTVCRRAERLTVRLSRSESISKDSLIYLNRLSDLLFVIARWVNFLSNTPEVTWKPGA
jgi:cob(I)alamin adenosyltransferase